jgi:hypothetical protein
MNPGPPRLNPKLTLRTVQVPLSAISYPGLSADGKWIALPAGDENDKWDLYFMNTSGGEVRKITDDPDFNPRYANISPDGSQVVYSGSRISNRGPQIRLVSSLGGASRILSEKGIGPHWSPNGHTIGYIVSPPQSRSGAEEFWSIEADGTNDRMIFADTAGVPGGRLVSLVPERPRGWIRTFRFTSSQELFVWGWQRRGTAAHRGSKNIDEDMTGRTRSFIPTERSSNPDDELFRR